MEVPILLALQDLRLHQSPGSALAETPLMILIISFLTMTVVANRYATGAFVTVPNEINRFISPLKQTTFFGVLARRVRPIIAPLRWSSAKPSAAEHKLLIA